MRLNKMFIAGALLMGLSLTACKKEPAKQSQETFDTYVGVDLAFPTAGGVRDLPEDYNATGKKWQGRDVIKSVDIYVVNLSKNKVNHTRFSETDITGIEADGKLSNKLAAKATAGDRVTAYAVVNDVDDKTKTILDGVPAGQFEKKFAAIESEVKAETIPGTNKYDAGQDKDIVLMTNKVTPNEITVKPNITADQAKTGTENKITIEVDRVVSRAIVTIAADLVGTTTGNAVISVKNAADKEVSKVTVTEVTYAVGQGNKSFYLRQQPAPEFRTPSYDWIPAGGKFVAEAKEHYDYSGLKEFKVPEKIASKDEVEAALNGEKFSKFVLPVTHADKNSYKKGNTTYFEIRCKFTAQNVDENGGLTEVTSTDGSLYLGLDDGKFYTSEADAKNADKAKNQKVRKYDNSVMKYIIWLNPNTIEQKYELSPTVRNQVYHAHIKGFKEIGVAHNPLNPDEPKDPDNPIDPEDPLENSETHLSVEVQVLPWTIHSYEIDLSNKY